MAGNKTPKSTPNSGFIYDSIQSLIGGDKSSADLHKSYLKTQQYCDEFVKSLVKSSKSATQHLASNAEESMDAFFDSMKGGAHDASKSMSNDLSDAFKHAGRAAQDASKHIDNLNQRAGRKKGANYADAAKQSGFSSFIKESVTGGAAMAGMSGQLSGVLGTLSGTLMEFVPELVAFTSAAALAGKVLQSWFHLGDEAAKFEQVLGGTNDSISSFLAMVTKVDGAANIFADDVRELGMQFYNMGGDISNTNANLQAYLTTGGKMMDFFGLSSQEMSKFMITMDHMGYSGETLNKVVENLYAYMKDGKLTIQDFNESMGEGNQIWREFGGITGRTLDQFTYDMLNARSMFKGFNVDVKTVASSMKGLFGDNKAQLHQAAMIGGMMGIPSSQAFMEKYKNPGQAMYQQVKSALRFLNQTTNGTAFMSADELEGNFGSMGAMNAELQKNRMMQLAQSNFGTSGEVLNQFMGDFQNARKASPNLSIDQWMDSRQLQGGGGGGGFSDAYNKYKQSPGQTFKTFQVTAQNFFDDFITKFLPKFTDLVNWLENAGHQFLGIPSSSTPSPRTPSSSPAPIPGIPGSTPLAYKGMDNKLHNAAIIAEEARRAGADPATMLASSLVETGGTLNSRASGDYGKFVGKKFIPMKPGTPGGQYTSFGLFQLHMGGALGGMSMQDAFDPRINAHTQAGKFAKLGSAYSNPGAIAAHAQRPANMQAYQQAVNDNYEVAQKILKKLDELVDIQEASKKTQDKTHALTKQAAFTGPSMAQHGLIANGGGTV